jgi:hypothetical protein
MCESYGTQIGAEMATFQALTVGRWVDSEMLIIPRLLRLEALFIHTELKCFKKDLNNRTEGSCSLDTGVSQNHGYCQEMLRY